MEGAAYWFASHNLFSLISYTPQDQQPKGDTVPSGMVFPQQH